MAGLSYFGPTSRVTDGRANRYEFRCAVGSAFETRYHPTFITFPKSLAEFFADKAKALLEIELDTPCVATVQSLIILSWHEGASNRDARGWLYSGKLIDF